MGATAMLAAYAEPIAVKVCDPIRGLPSTMKFLPSIAEIREACEREAIWHDAVERRERERAHTREVVAPAPAPTAESQRRVREKADVLLAELNAKREARTIDFKPPRSPAEAEAARRHFEARLPELGAEYSARPVKVSRELVKQSAPPDERDEAL